MKPSGNSQSFLRKHSLSLAVLAVVIGLIALYRGANPATHVGSFFGNAIADWTGVFVTHSVEEAVFLSTRIVVLAPNPGRVHAIFSVDLPAPRTAALREAPKFGEIVAQVSHTLRVAMLQ